MTEVINHQTGERMGVELEIGRLLWLRDAAGELVPAVNRDSLPASWEYVGGDTTSEAFSFQDASTGFSHLRVTPTQSVSR